MAKQHGERFVQIVNDAKSRIREISVAETKEKIDRGDTVHLIDVREPAEWAGGHVPTAQYLGKGILERDIEAAIPDLNATVVLYCGGGFRSALAAENLQRMGYTNALSMAGGWSGWRAAGYPVEGGSE